MEDLLVIIVKLIIRWVSSGSRSVPPPTRQVSAPIPVIPPSELAKPPTPEQVQRRKAIAAAKSKLAQTSKPIAALLRSEMAKPPTPAQLQRRRAIAAMKAKQAQPSAPVRQDAAPAPQRPAAEPPGVLHPATLGTQIAAALRSRKNLATAMMMTELIAAPVALRRAGSN